MREQVLWDEHAAFMDGLVEDGFIVLGGPLSDGRRVLHVVSAENEVAIHARLADDPWTANGLLTTTSVERWTILLDSRPAARA